MILMNPLIATINLIVVMLFQSCFFKKADRKLFYSGIDVIELNNDELKYYHEGVSCYELFPLPNDQFLIDDNKLLMYTKNGSKIFTLNNSNNNSEIWDSVIIQRYYKDFPEILKEKISISINARLKYTEKNIQKTINLNKYKFKNLKNELDKIDSNNLKFIDYNESDEILRIRIMKYIGGEQVYFGEGSNFSCNFCELKEVIKRRTAY